jgi:hypothetical protein
MRGGTHRPGHVSGDTSADLAPAQERIDRWFPRMARLRHAWHQATRFPGDFPIHLFIGPSGENHEGWLARISLRRSAVLASHPPLQHVSRDLVQVCRAVDQRFELRLH